MATTTSPTIAAAAYAERLASAAQKARADIMAHGYAVVPDVLTSAQVERFRSMFFNWYGGISGIKTHHRKFDPHRIFKYHEVGHAPHMWLMRVWVADFWRAFYGKREVTTGFDGCCYVEKASRARDTLWTHTDQRITDSRFKCVQGLVALTTNEQRTLVVYPGSHDFHADFGTTVTDPKKRSKSFVRVPQSYLDRLRTDHDIRPLPLKIPAGALALWDSRVFHQNRYGIPGSEERLVLYTCMLPRDGKGNTPAERAKRKRYLVTRRTTSHWPYGRMTVNGKQPYTRKKDENARINYSKLAPQTQVVSKEQIDRLIE